MSFFRKVFHGRANNARFYFQKSEAMSFKVTFAVPPAWCPTSSGWRDENVDSPESLDEGTIGTLKLHC